MKSYLDLLVDAVLIIFIIAILWPRDHDIDLHVRWDHGHVRAWAEGLS